MSFLAFSKFTISFVMCLTIFTRIQESVLNLLVSSRCFRNGTFSVLCGILTINLTAISAMKNCQEVSHKNRRAPKSSRSNRKEDKGAIRGLCSVVPFCFSRCEPRFSKFNLEAVM